MADSFSIAYCVLDHFPGLQIGQTVGAITQNLVVYLRVVLAPARREGNCIPADLRYEVMTRGGGRNAPIPVCGSFEEINLPLMWGFSTTSSMVLTVEIGTPILGHILV
jgi:hypothetical protein